MRIGISVRGSRGQDFWRDGASQHAMFVAAALARLPFVQQVLLIDVGAACALPPAAVRAAPGLDIVTPLNASERVDVVIELAPGLDRAWLELMRSRGCTLIRCRSGPSLPPEDAVDASRRTIDWYDELWLLPKDALAVPLMRTQYGGAVRVVPFVWSPMFIEQRVAELHAGSGLHYGCPAAQAGRGSRIVAYEPDRGAATEPGIALLACEQAYRTQPAAIRALHVLNAAPLNAAPKQTQLAERFDLVRDGRATFDAQHDLVPFVARHADAVFVHQQYDADAYACVDVLYGDYPLIHNLPWLVGAGYYYPGDDAQHAARVLLAALHAHDATLDTYRARSHAVFAAVDPFSEANLATYARALLSSQRNARGG